MFSRGSATSKLSEAARCWVAALDRLRPLELLREPLFEEESPRFLPWVTWKDPFADPAPFDGDLRLAGDRLEDCGGVHLICSLVFSGESARLLRDGRLGGASKGVVVVRGVSVEDDLRFAYSCLVPRLADLRPELLDRWEDLPEPPEAPDLSEEPRLEPPDLSEEPKLEDLLL